MSSPAVVQTEYFPDQREMQEQPSTLFATLADVFQYPYWRVRFSVVELKFEASHAAEDAFADLQGFAHLRFLMGGEWVDLSAPATLFDALLSRAPEPESLSQLSAEDAALLLEHILTPVLEPLEAKLGLSVHLQSVQRATSLPLATWPVKFQCKAQGKIFPVAMTFQSPSLAKAFVHEIEALEALGPPMVLGLPLQIGPVFLSEEEIASLAVGDELLLGVTSFEGLSGIVQFDETQCWAVKLVEGKIEVASALQPAERFMVPDGPGLPLFYQLGVTGEDGTVSIGQRISLARIEERRMVISHGKRKIAGAKLVKVTDGVAMRITSVDAT
jgi:hypothetical protein